MRYGWRSGLSAFAFAALSASLDPGTLPAQQQWPNSPMPSGGQPVFPFFEGWYDNGDGTYTLSFGYLNRNSADAVEIPRGERNYLEPAQYDGRQPTSFLPSRQRGVFAVTITEAQRDQDVWWHLVAADGNDYKVPGRTRATAYQLDWLPRPHGSLAPLVWFESEREAGRGPEGLWSDRVLTTRVGAPITLAVSTRDPSGRDTSDRRFREPVPVRVEWSKFQGPEGEVTFTRDESIPAAAPGPEGRGRGAPPLGPEQLRIPPTAGTARVIASFPVAGEYVMRAQVDNWDAPDSSSGDQCCWTNAYIRVRVTQ